MRALLLALLLLAAPAVAHEGHGKPVLGDPADAEAHADIRQVAIDMENGTWTVDVLLGAAPENGTGLDVSIMASQDTFYYLHTGPGGVHVFDGSGAHVDHASAWDGRTWTVTFDETADPCGWGIAARTVTQNGTHVADEAGPPLQDAWKAPAPCAAPVPEPTSDAPGIGAWGILALVAVAVARRS